jgi:hypothetical protein
MKLWNDGDILPLEMTTVFPSLPVHLFIASVAADVPVPDHQGHRNVYLRGSTGLSA